MSDVASWLRQEAKGARMAFSNVAADQFEAAADEITRLRTALAEAREVIKQWQKPSYIRLHAGEMTAAEMRSVLAVVNAIARAFLERTATANEHQGS